MSHCDAALGNLFQQIDNMWHGERAAETLLNRQSLPVE
jgi:hypothetical protein